MAQDARQIRTTCSVFECILLGLQWAAISVPGIITLGRAIGSLDATESADQAAYLQRLFAVTAVTMVVQVFWGHRLPVISGPAAVLLVGVLASSGCSSSAVYTSMMIGGLLLTILATSGLLKSIRVLFTDNVVAVVLLLIAFTLTPTILKLLIAAESPVAPLANLTFALVLILAMFVARRYLTGIWGATVIVWSMLIGSPIYALLFPAARSDFIVPELGVLSGFMTGLTLTPHVQIGVLISFLVCYVALAINDLGSIQSMNRLLDIPDMDQRLSRGTTITGLANVLSGFLGVVGPVNYSLSPGVVTVTGCASRFTLLPAAAIIAVLAFAPAAIGVIGHIPSVVIGCVLLYILTSQVAAGLSVAFQHREAGRVRVDDGLVIGLPVLLGTVIAFVPPEVVETFPSALRPVLGNGFVVGVVAALILEHVLLRE